jgi:DNA integrity scanning protein DisA with diadenylate cyclase activity
MLLESASPPSFSTQDDAIVKRRERSPAAGSMVPMSQASVATRAPFGSLHSAARGIRRRSVEVRAQFDRSASTDFPGF